MKDNMGEKITSWNMLQKGLQEGRTNQYSESTETFEVGF